MFRQYGSILCVTCLVAALASCGGEDLGGGIGEFTTVNASAVSSVGRLESDLITGNTCTTGTSSGGNFETDVVNIDFTSTAQFTTGALNLLISKITVKYTPINPATTPALPDYVLFTNRTISPDRTVPVEVAVVPDATKLALFSRTTQNLRACSTDMFEYYVQVVFEVSEPGGNGDIEYVPANLNVAIADRV